MEFNPFCPKCFYICAFIANVKILSNVTNAKFEKRGCHRKSRNGLEKVMKLFWQSLWETISKVFPILYT